MSCHAWRQQESHLWPDVHVHGGGGGGAGAGAKSPGPGDNITVIVGEKAAALDV